MDPTDPIIDELHAIREAISRASGDDLQKIAEAARARQNSGDHEVVNLAPKRTTEMQVS